MPLTLPKLDDRTFDDLVEEALSLIRGRAPEWTNHNASDPGITIIELLAWVTEMLVYRVDRVGDPHVAVFLRLINGRESKPSTLEKAALRAEIRKSISALRNETSRAVTAKDYVDIALRSDHEIARAYCVPQRNLSLPAGSYTERYGHISVVVVPRDEKKPDPPPEMLRQIRRAMEPHRLLATRLHVVGPHYLAVGLSAVLMLQRSALERDVRLRVQQALEDYLHPLHGGPDGNGWPFGRGVYVSELSEFLRRQAGVDHVENLSLSSSDGPDRLRHNDNNELIAVDLMPGELVQLRIEELTLLPYRSSGG